MICSLGPLCSFRHPPNCTKVYRTCDLKGLENTSQSVQDLVAEALCEDPAAYVAAVLSSHPSGSVKSTDSTTPPNSSGQMQQNSHDNGLSPDSSLPESGS